MFPVSDNRVVVDEFDIIQEYVDQIFIVSGISISEIHIFSTLEKRLSELTLLFVHNEMLGHCVGVELVIII